MMIIDDREILEMLAKRIRSLYPEARVWAFGSRAQGDATWDSDFDAFIVLRQKDESIVAASLLYQKGILRRSVNSAYYAMFYAVMALLAIKKKETSKHGGAIGLFDREFVKKNIFSKDFSRWLHRAFDLRQRCD